MKKKIVNLCSECFYDYKASGIKFKKKNLIVKDIGDNPEKCYFESKKKLKTVL